MKGDSHVDRKVFDREVLLERMMDDEELVEEILSAYRQDSHGLIQDLKQALEQGDVELAHRHAHSLKGASANIAADALQLVAQEMEQASKAGDLARAASLVPQMETQYGALMKVLDNL